MGIGYIVIALNSLENLEAGHKNVPCPQEALRGWVHGVEENSPAGSPRF